MKFNTVSRTKLTALAIIDIKWQKQKHLARIRVLDTVTEGSTFIFADTRISFQHNAG